MYNKLERLRELISDIEMDEYVRKEVICIIEDLEREIDIQNDAYDYLSDEDNY